MSSQCSVHSPDDVPKARYVMLRFQKPNLSRRRKHCTHTIHTATKVDSRQPSTKEGQVKFAERVAGFEISLKGKDLQSRGHHRLHHILSEGRMDSRRNAGELKSRLNNLFDEYLLIFYYKPVRYYSKCLFLNKTRMNKTDKTTNPSFENFPSLGRSYTVGK